jgi:hypothetical protein
LASLRHQLSLSLSLSLKLATQEVKPPRLLPHAKAQA